LSVIAIIFIIFGFLQVKSFVLAEQSGSSPESGAASRIKIAYDWLVDKGTNYGATDASDWSNNWGSMWNRIMESAAWEPDGTATEADVASTKTFYAGNGDRTIKTGTASLAPDWSTQKLATKDDMSGTFTGEESTWTSVAGSPFDEDYEALNLYGGAVKQDLRTGLWWSQQSSGTYSNLFSLTADGVRPTGGNAIAFCDTLNNYEGGAGYTGHTGWYLPTMKEYLQAIIDGIYSHDHSFGDTEWEWTSTEISDWNGGAWTVRVYGPQLYQESKSSSNYHVRCVRRDEIVEF